MSLDGTRVLVTGASGFLGSHAVRALLTRGAMVHCAVRDPGSVKRFDADRERLTVHRCDILDYESLTTCIRAADPHLILHMAGDVGARRSLGGWENVARSVDANVVGTLNLVRAATESSSALEGIVRLGGLEEYGRSPIPFVESAREQPASAYAAAQVAATHFCQAVQPNLDFAVLTLRPALVYGPGQSNSFFIPQVIEACLAGKDFEMTHGTQSRDFVYVEDVVEGVLIAAQSAAKLRGAVINLASGKEHPIADIADLIVHLTGAGISIHRGARATSSGELHHLVGSTALATSLLGWEATTPLQEGLERTIRSYDASRL